METGRTQAADVLPACGHSYLTQPLCLAPAGNGSVGSGNGSEAPEAHGCGTLAASVQACNIPAVVPRGRMAPA